MCFFSLSSFPTIYFAPAGKKQSPKKYEVSILLFLMLCKEERPGAVIILKPLELGLAQCSCYPGSSYLMVPAGSIVTLCCKPWGELCLQSPGSPARHLNPPSGEGKPMLGTGPA